MSLYVVVASWRAAHHSTGSDLLTGSSNLAYGLAGAVSVMAAVDQGQRCRRQAPWANALPSPPPRPAPPIREPWPFCRGRAMASLFLLLPNESVAGLPTRPWPLDMQARRALFDGHADLMNRRRRGQEMPGTGTEPHGDSSDIISAQEVIQIVLLAKTLRSQGNEAAARRWEEKVAVWLRRTPPICSGNDPPLCSTSPLPMSED
jgi:hypothetical protein